MAKARGSSEQGQTEQCSHCDLTSLCCGAQQRLRPQQGSRHAQETKGTPGVCKEEGSKCGIGREGRECGWRDVASTGGPGGRY